MKRPAYEWVPDGESYVGGDIGEDWNLECTASGLVVGWAYMSWGFWRAGYAYEVCAFTSLADAAQWVEKQAGAR